MSGGIDGVGVGESLVQRRGVWRRGIAPCGGRYARLRRARGHSGEIAGICEARAERAREIGAMRRGEICKHGGENIRYPASQPLVPQTECPIHVSV